MVGRCLHGLAYVLTFPAATMLVDFIGNELESRGPHSWGEGWRYTLPASLLVGGLVLVIEEVLYRSWGSWPHTRWRFLFRSVILHTIYLALAVDIGTLIAVTSIDKALLAPALTGHPIAFLFLLVITSPLGLILGVVNAFVLWTRGGDTRVSAVLVGLLALIVVAPPISSWHTRVRTSGWVERSLNEVPSPPSSARVYTEYRGCTRCATADATAVYVADLSPGEICEFYRARVPQRLSVRKDSACSGNDPGSSLVLRADRSPSNNDASSEFFVLIIDQSGRDLNMMRMSEAGRTEAIRRARSAGKKTLYSVAVLYYADDDLTKSRKCPCEARDRWLSTVR